MNHRADRVFGVPSCIYPWRFDINFHTYYAIVARVTHRLASTSAAITADIESLPDIERSSLRRVINAAKLLIRRCR